MVSLCYFKVALILVFAGVYVALECLVSGFYFRVGYLILELSVQE